MIKFSKQTATIPAIWLHGSIAIVSGFLLCGPLKGQDRPANTPTGLPPGAAGSSLLAKVPFVQLSEIKPNGSDRLNMAASAGPPAARPDSTMASKTPRRITLEEAQQQAAAANPMAHLAQLQVEAAKQHRLGSESDYFPKISSTFANDHFNKFMGQEVTIRRPIAGGIVTAGLPLVGKDLTLVALTAAQPITPLFKLHEVVNIARADERVAMANDPELLAARARLQTAVVARESLRAGWRVAWYGLG